MLDWVLLILSSVRLNLVGKRVQVAEDAEHFHMETTRKEELFKYKVNIIRNIIKIYKLGFISKLLVHQLM